MYNWGLTFNIDSSEAQRGQYTECFTVCFDQLVLPLSVLNGQLELVMNIDLFIKTNTVFTVVPRANFFCSENKEFG